MISIKSNEVRTGIQDSVYWYRFVKVVAQRMYQDRKNQAKWQMCRKVIKGPQQMHPEKGHTTIAVRNSFSAFSTFPEDDKDESVGSFSAPQDHFSNLNPT